MDVENASRQARLSYFTLATSLLTMRRHHRPGVNSAISFHSFLSSCNLNLLYQRNLHRGLSASYCLLDVMIMRACDLGGIGCRTVTKGLLRSQYKHPEAVEMPPIYATGITAWAGGQKNKVTGKGKGSGLILH